MAQRIIPVVETNVCIDMGKINGFVLRNHFYCLLLHIKNRFLRFVK